MSRCSTSIPDRGNIAHRLSAYGQRNTHACLNVGRREAHHWARVPTKGERGPHDCARAGFGSPTVIEVVLQHVEFAPLMLCGCRWEAEAMGKVGAPLKARRQ